ncbi:MAG: alpha/beta hydrolase, partial [Candidatus Puniceispirillum sp.]
NNIDKISKYSKYLKDLKLIDYNVCILNNGKDAAAKIVQPALVVIAGADRMTPAKFGKAMANSLANSHCQILAGAGHMLPAEQPAAVNDALRHFLPT